MSFVSSCMWQMSYSMINYYYIENQKGATTIYECLPIPSNHRVLLPGRNILPGLFKAIHYQLPFIGNSSRLFLLFRESKIFQVGSLRLCSNDTFLSRFFPFYPAFHDWSQPHPLLSGYIVFLGRKFPGFFPIRYPFLPISASGDNPFLFLRISDKKL